MESRTKSLFTGRTKLKLPVSVIVPGIGAGLFYAFILYCFLYVSREAFRIFSFTEYYDLLILTDREVFIYNFFFALIALIAGQGVCFIYWFETPRSIFTGAHRKRVSIVNDQRVLMWSFLGWFSRMGMIFGFIFCMTFPASFYVFPVYPDYLYLFLLVVVVLYLNLWTTFRRTFRRESKKWFLTSMVTVLGCAVLLAFYNPIDYKRINENFLEKNIYHTYQMEIPEVSLQATQLPHAFRQRRSLIEDVFIVLDKAEISRGMPLIIADDKLPGKEELIKQIREWHTWRPPSEIPLMWIRFHIDARVPMSYIYDLNHKLTQNGIYLVGYVVIPDKREFDKRFYYDKAISLILQRRVTNLQSTIRASEKEYNIRNTIHVVLDAQGRFGINGVLLEDRTLLRTMAEHEMRKDSQFMFVLAMAKESIFGDYLFAFTEILLALNEIRNDLAMNEYQIPYLELSIEEQLRIREKIPYLIVKWVGL